MRNLAQTSLTPEARLVLLADGGDQGADQVREILDGPLDWRALLTLADRERAALPLWRTVRDKGIDVERPEATVLRHMAGVWEFRLLHLEQLLFKTLAAFNEAGVDAVLLKGSAAALSVHGGFTFRPMIDVDLLVRSDEAEDAWALAQTVGWRWDADAYPRSSYIGAHHLPPLGDIFGAGVGLEAHTRLWMPDHPFAFSEEDVRADSVELEGRGCRFRVPSASHQLLHCCIHFAWSHRIRSHAWRAFRDVRALADRGDIDWEAFVALARASRADTCCYWTLRLAYATVGLEVPASLLEVLEPPVPAFLRDRLERHFLMNLMPGVTHCPSLAIEKNLWRLAIGRGEGSRGIALPSDHARLSVPQRVVRHVRDAGSWVSYISRLA